MKVLFSVRLPIVGCKKEELVELPDDLTTEEIQGMYADWVWEHIDGGWEVVE